MFMRVRDVFKNKAIVVRDKDNNIVQSFKKQHLAPAEMERITILKDRLNPNQGTLTISLEEVK